MRTAIIVVAIIVAVIFFGGAFNIGSAPLFGHIDNVIGTPVLMRLHYALFFFLDTGERTIRSGITDTERDFKDFQRAPAGYDKRRHYNDLDRAKDY